MDSGGQQRGEPTLVKRLGPSSIKDRLLDALRAAVPAASSSVDLLVPGLGTGLSVTGAALVEGVWTPTFERRVIRYLDDELIPRLEALADRMDDFEKRLRAPIVTDTGYQTARAAGLTSDDRMHEYLASAVVAVLSDATWDSRMDRARMLSRILVDVTVTELRILELLADPRGWQERNHNLVVLPREDGRIALSALMLAAFPDLEEDPEVIYTALSSLETRGLAALEGSAEPESSFSSFKSFLDPAASTLGRQLLELLESGRPT